MTQREDALKFEQGRIKALQEERLHIQKKTFTKWINSFLQKARMEVEDLFEDLADGRRLLKLLEIISGERLPRPNSGRMRVHKIENVNKSLSFLHTKVRLESIGAEDIVDGNPRLILGLIWTIILRFQIQEIEIDVDEENESSEKKSAKDALLLWCQRKTNGYHGVHIHNFTDSWRSGLGFNALIHAHRPDLFRWSEVPAADHVETLNHAFDVAHNHLGIPRLLDAEDVDTSRPDEKSVMTYVASYYHTFARMKNEQKSGRRIANIIGQMMDCDERKAEYSRLVSALLEWIRAKIAALDGRELPNALDGIQRLLLAFKQYRTVEKPPKYKERSEIEALYFDINTMQKSLTGEPWAPMEGQLPQDLEKAWQKLEQAEHAREIALRTELLRQQRLEQLNYKFNTKSVLRKGYLKEMIQVLSDPRYGSNLAQVDATVKKHEAISADILARTERFEDLSAMAAELVREQYHGADAVSRTEQAVLQRWRELLDLLERHRASLGLLAKLMALLREADTVRNALLDMQSQFQSEEVGRHLVDVERLLQAHALQELQLGAVDDTIRRLVRQGAAAEGPAQPQQQLAKQLAQLEDAYDSLVAAAKDRKARLEDARNLYQFLEDHDEEEGWVTEKQRICRTEVAAKDLRGVLALKQKLTALQSELRAREHVSARHRAKGQSLIDAKHPKSAEIERRLASLGQQWDVLRELAAARDQQLADAAEAHQFYSDANEAESWLRDAHALLAAADVGRDAHEAHALLARTRTARGELLAYGGGELAALRAHADRLRQAGIHTLQLPTEVESSPALEEEEWVNESRLVPTEVWEEEPVERLEHRTVTEERSVPQVKALYAFTGQGISMAKGEVMFLMNKTNPDWWSVRKADRTDGFVPANYVREIEPRVVPVQVRRPEKVRTVQRVKKTVLVKQVVPVKRSRPPVRRASKAAVAPKLAAVETRMEDIQRDYDELLKLSDARRQQLEEAIKLYSFFAECDDFDKWMREKEKLLRDEEGEDSVDTAKRKYEKFVTDLSAATKRLENIETAAEALLQSESSAQGGAQAGRVTARRQQLRLAWDRLLRLKREKEKSLEGATSVELFSRTCDEALDWMCEKEQQLAEGGVSSSADLRSVQALQRRHAQLERELEPLKEKVQTVRLLAEDVKTQYPSERANVESRQQQIAEMWARCQRQAAERRLRLESAVGLQVFTATGAALHTWLQSVQDQLAQETPAKDVATAEEQLKNHQEVYDDIKAHRDEFKEVIGLGRQLLASNPALTDVAEKIKQLEDQQKAVETQWQEKESSLRQASQLLQFLREADHLMAASNGHLDRIRAPPHGSSVEEVEALLKRHEELEARLQAHDERAHALAARAAALQRENHHQTDLILARRDAVLERRDDVRQAAAERRRALLASLAHQQFLAAADELQEWIQDKTKTAQDQSYRDLANLERKLQKHEAFERELQANEKQLRNVESIGQSLQKSDAARAKEVSERLEGLKTAWDELVAASRDKGSKLRQASLQRKHRRSVEDAKTRLVELERSLRSEEVGTDLRTCKRLLTQHQALEQEISQLSSRADGLHAQGSDLVSAGHFDGAAISQESAALATAVQDLRAPARARRKALDSSLQFHKFAAEVANEQWWLSSRRAQLTSAPVASASAALKNHAKICSELVGRGPLLDRLVGRGRELAQEGEGHPMADKITSLCSELEEEYSALNALAAARGSRLEAAAKAQQFLHDAAELEAYLADRATALRNPDLGKDRDRAAQLLTRHKAMELELDSYAGIVAEMGRAAAATTGEEKPALVERHQQLDDTLQRLQRQAAQRQRALVDSICRHEYLAESAELEGWIQEQLAAAASDDYGQDYEHLLILRSKFEELRLRVESGAERFSQCEELAKKLLATDSPYIADIEKRQEALGESWQRLVDQIQSRGARLHAAGEIHRFHRDVGDALARAHEKREQLDTATLPTRGRDNVENDLVAIDAHMQVLQEEGARLQSLYPGSNVQQIAMQQQALAEAWRALTLAAQDRRTRLARHQELQAFLTQVRDLTSWLHSVCVSLEGGVTEANAQSARAAHDALRAELEHTERGVRRTLAEGQRLLAGQHPAHQEISERCAALASAASRASAAWASRQVCLDQLTDLQCFLRDCRLLHDLSTAQDRALAVEISPDCSVEEVENQLKKHEAFEKLLATQDEKLATLNSHGAKLLEQNHVESQRIADELRTINERRGKVHESCKAKRARLERARARAQFSRDAAEARAWLAEKEAKLDLDHGEVTSLEEKIKKLQKHQAFTAELAANRARLTEIRALADQLTPDPDVERQLTALQQDWARLQQATDHRGRGLEEAQDILEFNQQLDKIEAWIRDKEMMVQAHELGRDYEHCSELLRKLDDLDSDMKVDDKHVRNICALAQKLQQGPTQQAVGVAARRDAFLAKWKALSGALQEYKNKLTTSLELHSFNRDVEDTEERIAKKCALFRLNERGRDLRAAQELQRRHAARTAEAGAVRARADALTAAGEALAASHPERASEIAASLRSLEEGWENLQKLAAQRAAFLDEAIAEHKFDEDLKELEAWVEETVKRFDGAEPPESVPDAEALLQLHDQNKAEIDGRQKAFAALQKEVEHVPEKKEKLVQLAQTLDDAWLRRRDYLTQVHQLAQLKEQARETEDWLAAKEAFLNNDDLGEDLDAVETLIRKHSEFAKLLESQIVRVDELDQMGRDVLKGASHHQDYIQRRLQDILRRRDRLKESCVARGEKLEQSRALHELRRDLDHERGWISRSLQAASDHNYRDLSNLQSKIQKHTAFESELAANKGRIDDVVNRGEELVESKHFASTEVLEQVEALERAWRELQSAASLRRLRLQQAYQARVYLRTLGEHTAWLSDVEAALLSEDHGTDLTSVSGLLKRHTRLEQQVAAQAETANNLAETAAQLASDQHFMAEELLQRADEALNRYRQLQEPMQIRRDNLEDAALLHRWERDADEEFSWLEEREKAVQSEDLGSTLAEAQALLKKHLAIEAEIIARDATIQSVVSRATQLSRRGHFAAQQLDNRSRLLLATLQALQDAAAARTLRLQERGELMQLLSDISEAEQWIVSRRSALGTDVGRDEESVLALSRKLRPLQAELQAFEPGITRIDRAAANLQSKDPADKALVERRLTELRASYDELTLQSAKRQQRLEQSLKYFKFVQECAEVQEWIGEQMSTAASEDYGLDAEHVDALLQTFDNFLVQLNANEGRIEAVCEGGNALIEENAPETEKVKQRVEDIRGLWDDLKELALARQEALAGARQVHEFDRAAEETGAWVAEKEALLPEGGAPRSSLELRARRRRLQQLRDDLTALNDATKALRKDAERLGEAFPDAKEHVWSKLEDVTEALDSLSTRAGQASQQLDHAEMLQAHFGGCQELLAWTTEMLARVTAPELAKDVAGAERLQARHKDLRGEIDAKADDFDEHYRHGTKLIEAGHFMSAEIEQRMSQLKSRRAALEAAWASRRALYQRHLDALVFMRDADAIDGWISNRVPLVRDQFLGDSVPQTEELISRHRDLEGTIDSWADRLEALKRVTLIEQAFAAQRDEEEAAKKRREQKQEEERLQLFRRQELARIAEERRRDTDQIQRESEVQDVVEEEDISPAPQFDRLPKNDSLVKRAESMSVVKTPKRTPSFTTRRRTQSFRRHRGQDVELPPVEIEGFLERKQEAGCGGKRATMRSWRSYYSVLCGQLLCFFRDELDFASAKAAAPPVAILNARCSVAGDYRKRAHVFRLSCADGAEYLFSCSSKDAMSEWVAKLDFHASLPPALQLTPYAETQTVSSSSSANSSPEPRRRTQAEILQEHRASTAANTANATSETATNPAATNEKVVDTDGDDIVNANVTAVRNSHIESAVLPSLPPRQPQDDNADVVLRNSEHSQSAWGRSRFSNGRDINAEFIKSQQAAYGGPRPASVAGSGGSPALDQRPASRSSGESELSVSSTTKDKKDKKGVFGGLFSRKKRPQSHM